MSMINVYHVYTIVIIIILFLLLQHNRVTSMGKDYASMWDTKGRHSGTAVTTVRAMPESSARLINIL